MKLIYYDLNLEININTSEVNNIVIESPNLFQTMLIKLNSSVNERDEAFSLYDETLEAMDMHKCCMFLSTPLELSFRRRDIQKKLYLELQSSIRDNALIENYTQIQSCMMKLLDELQAESDFNISYNEDLDIQGLLKLYDVHISDPNGNFDENLIDYMIILNRLLGINLFMIANCDAFLSEESYIHIEKCLKYYNLTVIFFSSKQIPWIKSKNTYIIDIDLCEIH